MNWIQKNLHPLFHPYPLEIEQPTKTIRLTIGVGLFVTLFVFFFQLNEWEGSLIQKILVASGFGMITLIMILINNVLRYSYFLYKNSELQSNLAWEIFWNLWNFLSIAIVNFLFMIWMQFIPNPSLSNFLYLLMITFIIGGIPISIVILLRHNQSLRKQLNAAVAINKEIAADNSIKNIREKIELICIPTENQKEDCCFPLEQLLYINSNKNYLEIHLREGEDLKTKLVRNTLKNASLILDKYPSVLQCHRAYIVNCDQIKLVEGNAQGYKISLDGLENPIPVSRSYVKTFKAYFLNL